VTAEFEYMGRLIFLGRERLGKERLRRERLGREIRVVRDESTYPDWEQRLEYYDWEERLEYLPRLGAAIGILIDWEERLEYSLLHLECHFFNLESQSRI